MRSLLVSLCELLGVILVMVGLGGYDWRLGAIAGGVVLTGIGLVHDK